MDIEKRYIYIILSQTPTKFGWLIRKVAKQNYNHVSIAFDEKLEEMYSFARCQNKTPIVGGMVKEFPERFSLGKVEYVPVQIYRLEVEEEMYLAGKDFTLAIYEDPEYLYNLFSALTFPLFHGFRTFKAYTCSEFAAHFLLFMGFHLKNEKRISAYTPEDIGICFKDDLFYEGNLLTYSDIESKEAEHFFEELGRIQIMKKSMFVLFQLCYRRIRLCGL